MDRVRNFIYQILRKTNVDYLKKQGLKIGKNVSIHHDVFIDQAHCWLISIGDNCTIAPRVMIFAHDASTKRHIGYTKIKKVSIGEKTFIGASSIILPGVNIGKNVVIGAGSVVTKDIPDNSIAAGNPIKVLGNIYEYVDKNRKNLFNKPTYSDAWTTRGNITKEMKEQMSNSIKDVGYVE